MNQMSVIPHCQWCKANFPGGAAGQPAPQHDRLLSGVYAEKCPGSGGPLMTLSLHRSLVAARVKESIPRDGCGNVGAALEKLLTKPDG